MAEERRRARTFRCDFPRCSKVFSRSDHLSRHKLNHAPTTIYRCTRCPRQFVRADLLARHESRHDRREQQHFQPPPPVAPSQTMPPPPPPPPQPPSPQQPAPTMPQIPSQPLPFLDNTHLTNSLPNSAFVFDDPSSYYGVGLEPSFFSTQDYLWLFDDQDSSNDTGSYPMTPPALPPPSTNTRNSTLKPSSPSVIPMNVLNPVPQRDMSTYIDEETHQRIISMLGTNKFDRAEHFTPSTLQHYLQLYWVRFGHIQYPIIHRPTFSTKDAHTLLLCAMISIGAYFANDGTDYIFWAIHSSLRGNLICSRDFCPRAELSIIQTSLLLILYGKFCARRPDHEMAHVFWGSCITLYRRAALFTPRAYTVKESKIDDLESHWRAWILEESAKRAAFAAFEIDITHFALFRHSPTLSAFHIQLSLQADENEWNAPTALAWQEININAQSSPPPIFLTALKTSLATDATVPNLSACARVSLLHGLMSVAFDLQWKDHFVTGINPSDSLTRDWKGTVCAAYNRWKSRLDAAQVMATYPSIALLRNTVPLYAVAHMTISLDIHELQIHAGAHLALGLPVPSHVVENCRKKVEMWASSKEGRASVWHAAHFLRSCLIHRHHIPDDFSGSLHIYVGFLACMCLYCFSGGTDAGLAIPSPNEKTMSAIEYLDTICTDSPDLIKKAPPINNTRALLQEVSASIRKSKWDIASEGANIIDRLLDPVTYKTKPTPTHQMASSGF